MAEFGEKLRVFRASKREHGSLDDFYGQFGISGATGSRYETGKTEPPLSFLQALSDKYGEDVAHLMPGSSILIGAGVSIVPGNHDVPAVLLDRRVHVRQASRMLLAGIKEAGLEGLLTEAEENQMIDQLADGLSSERSPGEIAERLQFLLGLAAKALRK